MSVGYYLYSGPLLLTTHRSSSFFLFFNCFGGKQAIAIKLAKAMSTLDCCCFANLFALFRLRFGDFDVRFKNAQSVMVLFYNDGA